MIPEIKLSFIVVVLSTVNKSKKCTTLKFEWKNPKDFFAFTLNKCVTFLSHPQSLTVTGSQALNHFEFQRAHSSLSR